MELQAKERLRIKAEKLFSRVKVLNWLNFYCYTEVEDPDEDDPLKFVPEALRVRPPPLVHEDIIQALEAPVKQQIVSIDLTIDAPASPQPAAQPDVEIIDLPKDEEYDSEDPKIVDRSVRIRKVKKRTLEIKQ